MPISRITVDDRIDLLERRLRRAQALALGAVLLLGVGVLSAWRAAPSTRVDILRARMLVLEDSSGRPRIMVGAPLPSLIEDGHALPARTGFVILDTAGLERMGLTLKPSGNIGFGLDAPAGVGDDRNRERINLTVGRDGSAEIRMLDQQTFVRSRFALDRNNAFSLQLLDFPPGETVVRRVTAAGDTTVRTPRQ